ADRDVAAHGLDELFRGRVPEPEEVGIERGEAHVEFAEYDRELTSLNRLPRGCADVQVRTVNPGAGPAGRGGGKGLRYLGHKRAAGQIQPPGAGRGGIELRQPERAAPPAGGEVTPVVPGYARQSARAH